MALTRAKALENSLLYMGQIPYNQGDLWDPDGYRQDCSGYISRCWELPKSGPGTWGGYSTETLVTQGIMYEIPWDQLQPGDAIGLCGPGTSAPNPGHIMLWVGRSHLAGRHVIRDHGSGMGPVERTVVAPSNYKAYRFSGIEGAFVPDIGYRMLEIGMVGRDVRQLQEMLNKVGAGLTVDGEFGPITLGAVKNFQKKTWPNTPSEWDGIVGPKTLAALREATKPAPQPAPAPAPTPTPVPAPADPVDLDKLAEKVLQPLVGILTPVLTEATKNAVQSELATATFRMTKG